MMATSTMRDNFKGSRVLIKYVVVLVKFTICWKF